MFGKIKITERDKRTLKLGAIGVVLILVFVFASSWYETWKAARGEMVGIENRLSKIRVDPRKQAGLLDIVPVFEMPQDEETQKFLFRDKLNEQIKQAGIKSNPLEIMGSKKQEGYKVLRIKCTACCQFRQALNLLAALPANPYLVAVEEFRIRVDTKKRQEVDMDLVVSTFVK